MRNSSKKVKDVENLELVLICRLLQCRTLRENTLIKAVPCIVLQSYKTNVHIFSPPAH